jgi:predicted CoA-binding protein
MKKTVVLGASPDKSRYSYFACTMLEQSGIPFVPVGIRSGRIKGKEILDLRQKPDIADVHTVSLYISPAKQVEWYEYMLDLAPKRIIFNLGTENEAFAKVAQRKGIAVEFACSLVLLRTGQF